MEWKEKEKEKEGVLLTRVKDLPLIPHWRRQRAAATSARQTCRERGREGGRGGRCVPLKVPLQNPSLKREDSGPRTRFFPTMTVTPKVTGIFQQVD